MTKNIILCADGTGNKGGYTPDSNVYKIYNAIEIHNNQTPQYTFYDNGVGTSTNKYWRAITGAFGIGIKQNILDLYTFLALHYEPENNNKAADNIYLFGFSRGAATIRALCGFIATTGLVNGKNLSDKELKQYTKDAYRAYKRHKKDPDTAKRFAQHPNSHGIIKIHFVGVWDTVSALGFPKRTDTTSLSLLSLDIIFKLSGKILNMVWPHEFYRYELTDNIQHAFHALAIDDERTAFWPLVWDETSVKQTEVEQVWFSGMHSNVGGGYERAGMSNVTLHWMMLRAQKYGLSFKDNAVNEVYANSNIHGRLYNSRDGMAIYYRYHPRNIAELCKHKLKGNIKIHCSTFERMKKRTANYSPIALPKQLEIVQSDIESESHIIDVQDQPKYAGLRQQINKFIARRKRLYGHFIDVSVLAAIYIYHLANKETNNQKTEQTSRLIDKISQSNITDFLNIALDYHPVSLSVFAVLALILFTLRKYYCDKMQNIAESIRECFLAKLPSKK